MEPHRDYLFNNFFGTSGAEAKTTTAAAAAAAGVEEQTGAAKGTKDASKGLLELCEVRESSILAFLDWMDEEWGDVCRGRRGLGEETAQRKEEEEEEEEETVAGVRGWLIDEMGFEDGDLDRIVERLRSGQGGEWMGAARKVGANLERPL